MTDKRAVFFFGAAVACLLLVPVTPDSFTWVGVLLAIVYVVLGAASALDHRNKHR